MEKFKLSQKFLQNYEGKQPNWGFGTLSYFTYKRTYSRFKEDGTQEEFFDTIKRCVEGCFNIQLNHCRNSHLPWDAYKAQKSAQTMFKKMWEFKFLPPGRGLWVMGTPILDKLGSTPLLNCGFISTKDIDKDFAEPFAWAADMLMLGVGIGYDTLGAGKVLIVGPHPTIQSIIYEISDTREGWVDSLKVLLQSYVNGSAPITFNYKSIRPAGTPIKGFGGVASGPDPLRDGHESIRKLLDSYSGKTLDSVGITDIMNYIGKFVVAGNVRRSAEISIGDINDEAFITMKDFNLYPEELKDRRWMSNNSVVVTDNSDFSKVIDNIALNGEPGLIFLENSRKYGRLKDGPRLPTDHAYDRVTGYNPSLRGSTLVLTNKGIMPIAKIASDYSNQVKVKNFRGEWHNCYAFKSGVDKQLYKIRFSSGQEVYCTPEHKWPVLHFNQNHVRDKKENIDYYNFTKLRTDELSGNEMIYFPASINPLHDEPSKFNNQDGFMLGWWLGDGWTTHRFEEKRYQIGCIVSEKDTINGIKDIVQSYIRSISKDDTISGSLREGHTEYNVSNKKFVDRMLSMGALSKNDGIPNIVWTENNSFTKSFIDGLYSSDGCISYYTKAGKKIYELTLSSSRFKIVEDLKKLLAFYGISVRTCKTQVELNGKFFTRFDSKITGYNIVRFSNAFSLSHKEKQFKLEEASKYIIENSNRNKNEYLRIESVTLSNIIEDVFDITVHDDTHTFLMETGITGNCAEQGLESHECCNLVETFVANHDTPQEYYDTLKYAYLFAKSVTLLPTHCEKTNQIMLQNRRIGCSQSGIQQAIKKFGIQKYLTEFCDKGYQVIDNWDHIYSRWLGIPTSIKMTTVKPSGTVSILAGATPGVHCTHSEYYLRTIRIAANSPLVPKLKQANYRIEESITDKKTLVVYFPVKESNFTKSKYDISLWEQLTLVKELQHYWSDNAVSCTVTFKPEEIKDLKNAIEFFAPYVKTLSFLPLDNHNYDQAPYQTCTEQEYEIYSNSLHELDLSDEKEEAKGEKYCTNDSCSI